ncbi:MAG TPA: hypothetical protein VHY10_00540 [Xanthobacteraceae bacterium]|jgi:hypothetical protein|nr:hypothetical protein [Xanthobacteraceae bacterium]
MMWVLRLALAAVLAVPVAARAQQQPQQQGTQWAKLPRMQLERQFAGPLQDTVIQRWRDPVDGMICYIYLPITAAHSAPTASGFVEYGANIIGSISCLEPAASPKPAAPHR